jgi:hypothetical protein
VLRSGKTGNCGIAELQIAESNPLNSLNDTLELLPHVLRAKARHWVGLRGTYRAKQTLLAHFPEVAPSNPVLVWFSLPIAHKVEIRQDRAFLKG